MIIILLSIIAGFYILMKGADWLVEGASNFAKNLGISDFVIGITIVAVGTSLPELAVSVYSSMIGAGSISVGNIIGSNITNIALVIGVVSILRKIRLSEKIAQRDIALLIGSAFVCFPIMLSGEISRFFGVLLVGIYLAYMIELIVSVKDNKHRKIKRKKRKIEWKYLLFVIIGSVSVIIGSKISIWGVLEIVKIFHISERLIGLTLVALGTSLPELASAVTASLKGKGEMAIGNIAGSNAFNILGVMGISAIVNPLPIVEQNLVVDLPLMLLASLFFVFIWEKDITRFEGIILITFYIAYLVLIFLS